MDKIRFQGIKWVKGYKDYNKPFKRVSSHPTVVFSNDKYYYFINLTSINESKLRDCLRDQFGSTIVICANDVARFGMIHKRYPMNIMNLVARVPINEVTTFDYIGTSNIEISNSYKCSNNKDLKEKILTIIKSNVHIFYVYNGSDDNYQSPDLNDNECRLPFIEN